MGDRVFVADLVQKNLPKRNYTLLFIEDLVDLLRMEGSHPEVVLREVRELECPSAPLMRLDSYPDSDERKIPVWIGDEEFQLNRSPSATKKAKMFDRKSSPLYGLFHQHYFDINNYQMISKNLEFPPRKLRKYKEIGINMVFFAKVIESSVTGEWIVFKDDGFEKTYLCLWKHGDKDSDQALADRLISYGVRW